MFPQNKFVRIQIMLNITPVSDYVVWVVSSSSNPVRFITSSYVSVRSLSIIASQVRYAFDFSNESNVFLREILASRSIMTEFESSMPKISLLSAILELSIISFEFLANSIMFNINSAIQLEKQTLLYT